MARYITIKNSIFQNSFLNIDEAKNHAMENFEAKLINGDLCDKNGDRKTYEDIFEENGNDFKPLKNFIDPLGIAENEVTNAHIEDGQLVITLKDGTQKKIKY